MINAFGYRINLWFVLAILLAIGAIVAAAFDSVSFVASLGLAGLAAAQIGAADQ